MKGGFTLLDVLVLVTYLVGTTTLGLWLGRRQKDAKDYFVADRAIPWWAVMFSIVASETSALTFISMPGLAYGTKAGVGDLGFLQIVAGYVIGRFVVAHALPIRYLLSALIERDPAARVEPVPYAEPYRLSAGQLERATTGLEHWCTAPAFA